MGILRRRLRWPSKPFGGGGGGRRLSLIVGGTSGHGRALLPEPRLRLREGDVAEFDVGVPPHAQLPPLGVDRDEQIAVFSVTLVRDPEDDFARRKRFG
jgi:hypothetical protein